MSLLMVHEWMHYSALKNELSSPEKKISDGNLASHLKTLKANDYVTEKKEFVNNKPHTTYKATSAGRKAFEVHLNALEALIKGMG